VDYLFILGDTKMLRNSSNYFGDLLEDFWNDLIDTAKYYTREYKDVEFSGNAKSNTRYKGNTAVLDFEAYFPTPVELEELLEIRDWDSVDNWFWHEGRELQEALEDMLSELDWDITFEVGDLQLNKRNNGLYCNITINLNLDGYTQAPMVLARKYAKDLPKDVERYVEEGKEQGMDESKAWAVAWSRYCQYKNPGSEHCKQDEYFPGRDKKAKWDITQDEEDKIVELVSQGWKTGNKRVLSQAIQLGLGLGLKDDEMEYIIMDELEEYLDSTQSRVERGLKPSDGKVVSLVGYTEKGDLQIELELETSARPQDEKEYIREGIKLLQNAVKVWGIDFLDFDFDAGWEISDDYDADGANFLGGSTFGVLQGGAFSSNIYRQLK